MKSEVIIIAAMKEHEHEMINLKTESEKISSEIDSTTENNSVEKNKRITIR